MTSHNPDITVQLTELHTTITKLKALKTKQFNQYARTNARYWTTCKEYENLINAQAEAKHLTEQDTHSRKKRTRTPQNKATALFAALTQDEQTALLKQLNLNKQTK